MKSDKEVSSFGMDAELFFRSVLSFFIIVLGIIGMDFSNQIKNLQEISVSIECVTTINAQIQRLVRMEVTYEYSDGLIQDVDQTIEKLLQTNHFILMEENELTETFSNMIDSWENLKKEIYIARLNGWHSTRILYAGETAFYMTEKLSEELLGYFLYLPTIMQLLHIFIFSTIALILSSVVLRCIRYVAVIRKQKQEVDNSYIDPATQVYNRAKCQEVLLESLHGIDSLFILYDLNHLKQVNDSLGHDCGDLLIASFAQSLKQAQADMIQQPFIGRYGGDEFIVYFKDIAHTDLKYFYEVLESSVETWNQTETRFQIHFAFGQVYAYELPEASWIGDLFKLADKRMYEHKIESKKKRAEMHSL